MFLYKGEKFESFSELILYVLVLRSGGNNNV